MYVLFLGNYVTGKASQKRENNSDLSSRITFTPSIEVGAKLDSFAEEDYSEEEMFGEDNMKSTRDD